MSSAPPNKKRKTGGKRIIDKIVSGIKAGGKVTSLPAILTFMKNDYDCENATAIKRALKAGSIH
eukprot:m.142750 g.142750  ORF g.142750 m.142750 type:complete len:64 (-) comp14887_c0_seq2:490-681(-)